MMRTLTFINLALIFYNVLAFSPNPRNGPSSLCPEHGSKLNFDNMVLRSSAEPWQGDVVTNADGKIRGCSIQAVGDTITEWIVKIDGNEADLGRFSQAIYKKVIVDAKSQRFQGFRPGTIPPHIEPTYRAFAMDECARETVIEALEQNNIRPFSDARNDILITTLSFAPPATKKKKKNNKKKKGGKKQKENSSNEDEIVDMLEEPEVEEEPAWLTFETMKEAIDAGWKPGQTFSFVASNVKGQKVVGSTESDSVRSLRMND